MAGVKIEVSLVVANAHLGCRLALREIAPHLPNLTLKSENIATVLSLEQQPVKLRVCSSGFVRTLRARSVSDAKAAMQRFVQQLLHLPQEPAFALYHTAKVWDFKVSTMLAGCEIGRVSQRLKETLPALYPHMKHDPDMYGHGLWVKGEGSIGLRVHSSGKCIVSGITSHQDALPLLRSTLDAIRRLEHAHPHLRPPPPPPLPAPSVGRKRRRELGEAAVVTGGDASDHVPLHTSDHVPEPSDAPAPLSKAPRRQTEAEAAASGCESSTVEGHVRMPLDACDLELSNDGSDLDLLDAIARVPLPSSYRGVAASDPACQARARGGQEEWKAELARTEQEWADLEIGIKNPHFAGQRQAAVAAGVKSQKLCLLLRLHICAVRGVILPSLEFTSTGGSRWRGFMVVAAQRSHFAHMFDACNLKPASFHNVFRRAGFEPAVKEQRNWTRALCGSMPFSATNDFGDFGCSQHHLCQGA